MNDRPQDKLRRMSAHFDEEGFYTKANYCIEIIDYINILEAIVDKKTLEQFKTKTHKVFDKSVDIGDTYE